MKSLAFSIFTDLYKGVNFTSSKHTNVLHIFYGPPSKYDVVVPSPSLFTLYIQGANFCFSNSFSLTFPLYFFLFIFLFPSFPFFISFPVGFRTPLALCAFAILEIVPYFFAPSRIRILFQTSNLENPDL